MAGYWPLVFLCFMDRDEVKVHKTVSSLLKQKHMKEFLLYIFVLMFH